MKWLKKFIDWILYCEAMIEGRIRSKLYPNERFTPPTWEEHP